MQCRHAAAAALRRCVRVVVAVELWAWHLSGLSCATAHPDYCQRFCVRLGPMRRPWETEGTSMDYHTKGILHLRSSQAGGGRQ